MFFKVFPLFFFLFIFSFGFNQGLTPHLNAFVNNETLDRLEGKDTGYVDICSYDTIHFKGFATILDPTIDTNSCDFEWTITGTNFYKGKNIDFSPSDQGGYYVELKITDINKKEYRVSCRVRVASVADFNSLSDLPAEMCIDKSVKIKMIKDDGSYENSGVKLGQGRFKIGGLFKSEIKLPDGLGVEYHSKININDYGNNTKIQSIKDIEKICITMEHSFLGDVEVKLTCPSTIDSITKDTIKGISAVIFNSYKGLGGMVPGGFGGKDVFIGNDLDIDNGPIGIPGWQYCFSNTKANFSSFGDEYALSNFKLNNIGMPAMNPDGIYLPEEPFYRFIGCPVKGEWILSIKDNVSDDDGYIFNWGILFDSKAFPIIEKYQNTLIEQKWYEHPAITEGISDTVIFKPLKVGQNQFTYHTKSNFGCVYDTSIFVKTNLCLNIPNVININSKDGNDKFYLSTGDVKSFECLIYNRWGNLIHKMSAIYDYWDGKNNQGKFVEEGTYFYIAKIIYNDLSEAPINGFIYVQH